jgi:hypothetical protein
MIFVSCFIYSVLNYKKHENLAEMKKIGWCSKKYDRTIFCISVHYANKNIKTGLEFVFITSIIGTLLKLHSLKFHYNILINCNLQYHTL